MQSTNEPQFGSFGQLGNVLGGPQGRESSRSFKKWFISCIVLPYAYRIPETIKYLCEKLDIEDDSQIKKFLPQNQTQSGQNQGVPLLPHEAANKVPASQSPQKPKKRGRDSFHQPIEPIYQI